MSPVFPDFDLTGRVALVIGCGETGTSLARALGRACATIILVDPCGKQLSAAKARLADEGIAATGIPFDISGRDQAFDLVRRVVQSHGKVDVLVNAMENFLGKAAVAITAEEWKRSLHVNLKSVFWACQAAGKHMLEQGEGSIINLSSVAGALGFPDCLAFAASKGGVEQLTRTLGVEWICRGVRVNAIAGWSEGLSGQLGSSQSDKTPLGRLTTARDFEGLSIYLASPASAALSGEIIRIDGGYSAQ